MLQLVIHQSQRQEAVTGSEEERGREGEQLLHRAAFGRKRKRLGGRRAALQGGQNRGGPESATGSCKREGNGNFFLHLISLGISGAEKVLRHVRQNFANCKDGDEGEQRTEYQETSV